MRVQDRPVSTCCCNECPAIHSDETLYTNAVKQYSVCKSLTPSSTVMKSHAIISY